MKIVRNKTHKPIRVPLGGGKVLHLGPSKTGQVSPQAAERPAFLRLLEQGDVELLADGEGTASGLGETGRIQGSTQAHKQLRLQRKGDR